MATPVQRMQAIADALINATATPTQINRLGVAYAADRLQSAEYGAATNAEKQLCFLDGYVNR